ncbi:MAG: hypothetical protein GW905_01485 [Rhodobacterales bacterium]|nr:hypothetical protein [Rhodobacterales bacterium]
MTDWRDPPRPYAIAHRGASAWAQENTLRAFAVAADLGADFWEIDIRTAADRVMVVYHDPLTPSGRPVADLTAAQLAAECSVPTLDAVIALAKARGTGIYADIKAADPVAVAHALNLAGIEMAILGAFDPAAVAALKAAGVGYPTAALVPLGADPFVHAAGADIIHLCWERMQRPQDMLTPEFLERARATRQRIVLWHEEDPQRMKALRDLPILGICSNMPELVQPFRAPRAWPVKTVAHRGANSVAPENTLPAATCAFAVGFDWVELDVRSSADAALVVIHDASLARTTDGTGLVKDMAMADLRALDAGRWFDPHFAATHLPTLGEMLAEARRWDRGIYIEIKQADPLAVLAEVQAAGMVDRCFFWGWDYRGLVAIKTADPLARVMTRRKDFDRLDACFAAFEPAIIEYDSTDDWSDMDTARHYGAAIMICYMGRDPAIIDRVIAARPDIVNIDDMFLFRRRMQAADFDTHGR